jgi:hypothetical protein
MFSQLLGNIKKQRKLHSWRNSALGRAISEHTRNCAKTWNHFKKEDKEQLAYEFNTRIFDVLSSSQPIIRCRQELVANVIAYTNLQVLCLTVQDKDNSDIFNNMKRISSDLHDHIYKCTLCNDELNKYIEENGYNESALFGFVNNRCAIYRYHAFGFDIIRKSIEPATDRDWFFPLVQSSMIISESNYRKYLGLPAIVTAIDSDCHSKFIDMALNGEQDPLLTWERRYGKSHSATV